MQNALSFDQAPPISAPYRFFLTAPLFGVAAGLLLAWLGPAAFASRWTPGAAALTHLLAAGFMLQVMCGALLQFVAVVAGANIWRPLLVAAVVHPSITLAAALLAAAFLLGRQRLFLLAAGLFAVALVFFLMVMAIALLRTPARGASLQVLRLALIGLLATMVFGVALAASLGGQGGLLSFWSLFTLIDVHVAWGMGGWALMLVIGVSFLVVPMFQLTPAYPVWLTRVVPAGLFLLLCLWTAQLLSDAGEPGAWQNVTILAGTLLTATYAVATLWLQARRRRRQSDITLIFWRGAMLALGMLAASSILFQALPPLGQQARAPLWLGVLAFAGVFLSVIMGMLYKIMPFLNWLHLQQPAGTTIDLPNMKQMIPQRSMRVQMLLHFSAVALLLAAVIWPALALPAGLTFSVSCLCLEWNLISATRVYVRFSNRISADAVSVN